MTALLDLTAELPVWAVAASGVMVFLLGLGARQTMEIGARRKGCARCRTNARHHQRLTDRPAWLGWPGHHAGHLSFPYGDELDPGRLEPTEKLPARTPTAPTGTEVRIWLLTERVLETAGLSPAVADTWDALPDPVHPRSPHTRIPAEWLTPAARWESPTTERTETIDA